MTMTLKNASFAILFSLTSLPLLGACSGKTNGQSTPVPQADFSQEYAKAICDGIQGCCSEASFKYDEAACVATGKKSIDDELKIGPSVTYDANAAGDCVAAARAYASSCGSAKDNAVQAACSRVFTGTKKLGETCSSDGPDCAPSANGTASCYPAGTKGSTGATNIAYRCVVVRPPQKGDACGLYAPAATTTLGDCQSSDSDFYCDYDTSTCQPRIAQGQACTDLTSCGKGLTCSGGVCAPLPTAGQPCASLVFCAEGLYCDSKSTTCVAQLKPGQECTETPYDQCGPHASCDNGRCSAGLATADTCAGIATSSSSDNNGSSSSGGGTTNGG